MPILTLVTPEPLKDFDLAIKNHYDFIICDDRKVLEDEKSAQWTIPHPLTKDQIDQIRTDFHIDLFQRRKSSTIQLFMADMDSTIVTGETLDDMAAMAGIGDKIANITARAMRGELDFESALTERVRMLAGQPISLIERALHGMTFNHGAKTLLGHLKSRGIYCVLISGGFTQFTSHVAETLGFDAHFGNELLLSPDGKTLSGEVKHPILDKNFKLQTLQSLQAKMGITPDQIMAIGDGANDLPMLQAAGMGIAYHGKPLLCNALINRIDYTDLASLTAVI